MTEAAKCELCGCPRRGSLLPGDVSAVPQGWCGRDGSPLSVYILLNHRDAYIAAKTWAVGHSQVDAPNIAYDAYAWIGAHDPTSWNANSTTMAELTALTSFKGEFAMEQGMGMKGSSLEFLAPPSGDIALVAEISGGHQRQCRSRQ
ncbi:MAG TPA: hypothetical protein VF808_11970 [Ktedonobacterales bacterium]